MFFSLKKPNSYYVSNYGGICIVIYGKRRSVPLNILGSVFQSIQ